jgi:hypothetical protein
MHQTSWILGVLFLASGVGLVRFLAFGAGILCVAVWEGIKDGERKGKKVRWTFYSFQQLGEAVLPNIFLTSKAKSKKKNCFTGEARPSSVEFISHETIFFSHNKSASVGLSAKQLVELELF